MKLLAKRNRGAGFRAHAALLKNSENTPRIRNASAVAAALSLGFLLVILVAVGAVPSLANSSPGGITASLDAPPAPPYIADSSPQMDVLTTSLWPYSMSTWSYLPLAGSSPRVSLADVPVIPEPAGLLSLSVGVIALSGYARRQTRIRHPM